jgi:uncharacterized membrane protein
MSRPAHSLGVRTRGAALAVAAVAVLGLAACGNRNGEGGRDGAEPSEIGAAMTDEAMKAQAQKLRADLGAAGDATVQAQFAGAFEAVGVEPYWTLAVLPDLISFQRSGLEEIQALSPQRDVRQQGLYVEGGPLAVAVKTTPCTLAEGGEAYPLTATVLFEGVAYSGCAKPGTGESGGRGWALGLAEFQPAIDACLPRAESKPARVSIAYRAFNGGGDGGDGGDGGQTQIDQIAVRMVDSDGGRSECTVDARTNQVAAIEPISDSDTLPGERNPLFTRAPTSAPAGKCWTTEEVKGSNGAVVGYLSRSTC